MPLPLPFRLITMALAAAALQACQTTSVPVAPTAAPAGNSPPVLESITLRHNVRVGTGRTFDVAPDYHFSDADGDVVMVMREIVETNGSIDKRRSQPTTPVYTDAKFQKAGAVFNGGGWICGPAVYYVKMRSWMVDSAGNRSEAHEYVIHCNGG